MGKRIVYHNLTQYQSGTKRHCYFRSTDVEQRNYRRLLWSVPDEMLYFISLGHQIVIKDKSSNKSGKIERIFIPVLNDLLSKLWLSNDIENKKFNHHYVVGELEIYRDRLLGTKFMYWKKRLSKGKFLKIKGKTIIVKKETNPLN